MYSARMATNLSATQLARNLSDILNRVRYADEAFVIMRNGEAVATLAPMTQDDEPTSEDSPLAPTQAAARQEAVHEPESVTKETSSEDQTTEDSDRPMAKLMEARSALERGDSRSAERTLDDFMTEVEAERGNSLTDHQADVIVDRIQNLARKMRRASRAPLPTASAPDSTDDS